MWYHTLIPIKYFLKAIKMNPKLLNFHYFHMDLLNFHHFHHINFAGNVFYGHIYDFVYNILNAICWYIFHILLCFGTLFLRKPFLVNCHCFQRGHSAQIWGTTALLQHSIPAGSRSKQTSGHNDIWQVSVKHYKHTWNNTCI